MLIRLGLSSRISRARLDPQGGAPGRPRLEATFPYRSPVSILGITEVPVKGRFSPCVEGSMVKLKLYLDRSVPGAVTDLGSEEQSVAARRLLDGLVDGLWEGYISTRLCQARAGSFPHRDLAQDRDLEPRRKETP